MRLVKYILKFMPTAPDSKITKNINASSDQAVNNP